MIGIDNPKLLLFIEPKWDQFEMTPVNDEWTDLMHTAFVKAKKGAVQLHGEKVSFRLGDGWMGVHCDERNMHSDSQDFLLENGMVTNSLCIYYLQHYRPIIHYKEWVKLYELKAFYEAKPAKV